MLLLMEEKRIRQVSNEHTLRALVIAQELITEAEKQVKFNAYFPQCLETLMISIRQENDR